MHEAGLSARKRRPTLSNRRPQITQRCKAATKTANAKTRQAHKVFSKEGVCPPLENRHPIVRNA